MFSIEGCALPSDQDLARLVEARRSGKANCPLCNPANHTDLKVELDGVFR